MSARPDVVELTQQLIRIDTTNPPGAERAAIAHVRSVLEGAGVQVTLRARDPERPNLIARVPGRGDARPLLLYGHVDVVPAIASQWTHAPFSGALIDGFVWGRGAVDMKGAVAQMTTAVIDAALSDGPPPGDVVFMAVSDEECGSEYGMEYLVESHPELFEDVSFALGEFGAFSIEIDERRFYPIQVTEKEWAVIRLTVDGPAGHGSVPVRGGAMAKLGALLEQIDGARLPLHPTDIATQTIERIAAELPPESGAPMRMLLDPDTSAQVLDGAGGALSLFEAMLYDTVTPTRLIGAERADAIPAQVSVDLDTRILPGHTPADVVAALQQICGPDVAVEVIERYQGVVGEPNLGLFPVLAEALGHVDPDGVAVPLLLPGKTDASYLSTVGVQSYGFTPLKVPSDFSVAAVIHGVDERVPSSALEFGVEVLARVIERYADVEAAVAS